MAFWILVCVGFAESVLLLLFACLNLLWILIIH